MTIPQTDSMYHTYVRDLGKIYYSIQSGYIVGTYIISDLEEHKSRDEKKHIATKDVVGLLLGEVVSTKTIAQGRRGCGWLAFRRGSKYKKNTHIVAKDVVGLQVGDDDIV